MSHRGGWEPKRMRRTSKINNIARGNAMKKLTTFLTGTAAAIAMTAGAAQAERGSDGHLNILYWQAVSILNPFLSGGTKDVDEAGEMVPALVDEIPTVENGGVAEDLKSVTWVLSEGLVWSDGTPVTAEDVKFTAEYCMAEDGGCQQVANFTDVESVEAVDERTVKINFSIPKPYPYGPFVGAQSPVI
jgi:peptide/nickel transport system substrate-binding protein